MNILLIGSGGREHALAWKLSQSLKVSKIVAAPGSPGIAQYADCVDVGVTDFNKIEKLARDISAGLVVIGPEDPLALGLTDRLQKAGFKVFGPNQAAAKLEGDKWFAKDMMRQQAVPTAEARSFTDPAVADEYVKMHGPPIVVKATGLAKGKGVTICYREADAIEAIDLSMRQRVFGDDEGDTGPMTGGMGAYSPTPMVTQEMLSQIEREVFVPILDGLVREGIEYKGILYAGLMLTTNGPRVLEFNCRFGDPETQPLMMRLKTDLLDVMLAVVDGTLDQITLEWDKRPAMCVVASSKGYPGKNRVGDVITGIDEADRMPDVKVFHSGTAQKDGQLVTSGGRVLAVTALGDTLKDAQARCYEAMAKIHFDGMHYRRDIGHRALK
jgi:phosphoribosylamine--glycine ligase